MGQIGCGPTYRNLGTCIYSRTGQPSLGSVAILNRWGSINFTKLEVQYTLESPGPHKVSAG